MDGKETGCGRKRRNKDQAENCGQKRIGHESPISVARVSPVKASRDEIRPLGVTGSQKQCHCKEHREDEGGEVSGLHALYYLVPKRRELEIHCEVYQEDDER